MKKIVLIILTIFLTGIISACGKTDSTTNEKNEEIVYQRYNEAEFKEAKIGKYYINGDKKSEYIEIISGNKLQFINYNKEEFEEILELYLSDFKFSDENKKKELHNDFQERLLNPYDYYIEDQDGIYVLMIDNFCGIQGSYMGIKYNPETLVLLINGKEYIYCEE